MLKILALISIIALGAFAAGDATFEASKRELNIPAIIMFFVFIAGTLGVTYWAAKKTKSASDFYTAGGGITGFQNGLAIAGDYMSAAALPYPDLNILPPIFSDRHIYRYSLRWHLRTCSADLQDHRIPLR